MDNIEAIKETLISHLRLDSKYNKEKNKIDRKINKCVQKQIKATQTQIYALLDFQKELVEDAQHSRVRIIELESEVANIKAGFFFLVIALVGFVLYTCFGEKE